MRLFMINLFSLFCCLWTFSSSFSGGSSFLCLFSFVSLFYSLVFLSFIFFSHIYFCFLFFYFSSFLPLFLCPAGESSFARGQHAFGAGERRLGPWTSEQQDSSSERSGQCKPTEKCVWWDVFHLAEVINLWQSHSTSFAVIFCLKTCTDLCTGFLLTYL